MEIRLEITKEAYDNIGKAISQRYKYENRICDSAEIDAQAQRVKNLKQLFFSRLLSDELKSLTLPNVLKHQEYESAVFNQKISYGFEVKDHFLAIHFEMLGQKSTEVYMLYNRGLPYYNLEGHDDFVKELFGDHAKFHLFKQIAVFSGNYTIDHALHSRIEESPIYNFFGLNDLREEVPNHFKMKESFLKYLFDIFLYDMIYPLFGIRKNKENEYVVGFEFFFETEK